MKSGLSLLLFSLSLLLAAVASSPTPPPNKSNAAPLKACAGPEFRQFDFWIGQWIVRAPNGQQVGTSQITVVAGGCAIREQWEGAAGSLGTSLNYYDPATGHWQQDWVGGDGTILHLRGRRVGNAMVMSQESETGSAKTSNRITWTPLADGKVQQHWEISQDEGKTWKTSFLGIYAH